MSLVYEMLKYLHSFYFNQGKIIWICLKGKELRELTFQEKPCSCMQLEFKRNLWTILARQAFIPCVDGCRTRPTSEYREDKGSTSLGSRLHWFFLAFSGVINIF